MACEFRKKGMLMGATNKLEKKPCCKLNRFGTLTQSYKMMVALMEMVSTGSTRRVAKMEKCFGNRVCKIPLKLKGKFYKTARKPALLL